MHAAAHELMSIMARDAESNDGCADQLAAVARDVASAGDRSIANCMMRLARQHRVRALELRGALVATSAEHDGGFHRHLIED